MNRANKVDEIIKFVVSFPESTAARAILKRNLLKKYQYESSNELSIHLKKILKKAEKEEIEFCYYLVK